MEKKERISNLALALEKLGGIFDKEGRWQGDREVVMALRSLCRPLVEFNELSPKECREEIRARVWAKSGTEIPIKYQENFWQAEEGKKVLEKLREEKR